MSRVLQSTFSENESWWIEYLEGEVSESQKEDMDLLLKHSETEKRIIMNFKKLRNAIKEGDAIEVPEGIVYLRNLHQKIMKGVLEAHKEKSNFVQKTPNLSNKKGSRRRFI